MSRFILDTFNTGSVAAGASATFHRTVSANRVNIGKWKVVPDGSVVGWVMGIFKRATALAVDQQFSTRDPVLGTKVQPSDLNGNEVLEGWVLPYEDLDLGSQIHLKITNRDAVARTYDISMWYEAVNGDRLDDAGNEVLKFIGVASAVNEVTITNAIAGAAPSIKTTGNDTDIPFLIQPKGTGALIMLPTGNARGAGAIDLNRKATSVDKVASGDWSVISGGYGNKTSTDASVVAGGFTNWASGVFSNVLGGYVNIASGGYSSIPNGLGNIASGKFSVAWGNMATVDKHAQWGFSPGTFLGSAGNHQWQYSFLLPQVISVDATPMPMYLARSATPDATNRLTVPNKRVWLFTATVLACVAGPASAKMFVRRGIISNNNGTMLLSAITTVGTDDAVGSPSLAATAIALTADSTNKALLITATGIAATVIRWAGRVDLVEITFE